MQNIKIPLSEVKWRIEFAIECTNETHSGGHFNALIRLIGLKNVLKYVSQDYLIDNHVNLSLEKDVSNSIAILEDE
jgi:hypothetical protein